MTLAPWRSHLHHALHRNRSKPYSRYFQLATLQADGKPANRTVVFRGFLGDTNQIKIITDTRSQKIAPLTHSPWAEISWYFTESREQFRITGTLTLIDTQNPDSRLWQARQATWQELSDNARIQFAWPHPGEPRAKSEDFSPPPPDPNLPLANFCLLLLDPCKVDHLELRGEPQNRWLYESTEQGEWSKVEINP